MVTTGPVRVAVRRRPATRVQTGKVEIGRRLRTDPLLNKCLYVPVMDGRDTGVRDEAIIGILRTKAYVATLGFEIGGDVGRYAAEFNNGRIWAPWLVEQCLTGLNCVDPHFEFSKMTMTMEAFDRLERIEPTRDLVPGPVFVVASGKITQDLVLATYAILTKGEKAERLLSETSRWQHNEAFGMFSRRAALREEIISKKGLALYDALQEIMGREPKDLQNYPQYFHELVGKVHQMVG